MYIKSHDCYYHSSIKKIKYLTLNDRAKPTRTVRNMFKNHMYVCVFALIIWIFRWDINTNYTLVLSIYPIRLFHRSNNGLHFLRSLYLNYDDIYTKTELRFEVNDFFHNFELKCNSNDVWSKKNIDI